MYTLELLNLPFTGPTTKLYDPPKELMKYLAYCEGVKTPGYVLIDKPERYGRSSQTFNVSIVCKTSKSRR